MRGYFFKTPAILKKLYPGLIWDKQNVSAKCIYLTFDDGPIPEVTPWVLDQLKKSAVKATFFMVGDNIEKHPKVFNEVLSGGHSIGNHTFNHLNGWKTRNDIYQENVRKCSEVLKKNGIETNLFRPPYGKVRRDQITELKKSHQIIMWDYLTGDFDQTLSAEEIIRNFKKSIRTGSIVVFHDNIKSFEVLKKSLPVFLQYFKEQEYQFLTL